MSFLDVQNLTMRYAGDAQACVRNLSLQVDQGKILVLLGASGCGKSTVLKGIAGLEKPQEGQIFIDGEPMNGVAPERRPVAMVFQKALLFRNMTVEKNVNFAPRVNRSLRGDDLKRRTDQMLALVDMKGMGNKKATALSGGQEQRVSLARALMCDPKLLLLDEPLSALDASLRETMQDTIRRLNRETGTTMVLVTHDQQEAIALADNIAVMHEGGIVQLGAPHEFYERPRTAYVASFFGWKNFLPATREGERVSCALGTFSLPDIAHAQAPSRGLLVMRPEAATNVGTGTLSGTVSDRVYRGMTNSYCIRVGNEELRLALPSSVLADPGEKLSFDLDPSLLWFVDDSEHAIDAQ